MVADIPTCRTIGSSLLILVFFFAWVQLYSRLDALDTQLNVDNLTPTDYTIMVSGLPTHNATEEELFYDKYASRPKINIILTAFF